jgi:hypothetical protein
VDNLSARKKKVVERTVLLLALCAAAALIALSVPLYQHYLSITYPKSNVYGTWVEQDVARYSAEIFTLGPAGVSIDGGVVDTKYSFDGTYVEYQVGDKERRYLMLNESFTKMKLISQPHYQPVFHLSENVKNNIR